MAVLKSVRQLKGEEMTHLIVFSFRPSSGFTAPELRNYLSCAKRFVEEHVYADLLLARNREDRACCVIQKLLQKPQVSSQPTTLLTDSAPILNRSR